MAFMQIVAFGTPEELTRPCVDCGDATTDFCEYCFAADRMPNQVWAQNQATPLCMTCDKKHDKCNFCRADQADYASMNAQHSKSTKEQIATEGEQLDPAGHGQGQRTGRDNSTSKPVFGPEPPPGLIEALKAAETRARAERK